MVGTELKEDKTPVSLGNAGISLGLGSKASTGITGLKGSIRHVTLFSEAISTEQELKNIAFRYLYPTKNPSMLMELPLDDNLPNSGLFEQVNKFDFDIFKRQADVGNHVLEQV